MELVAGHELEVIHGVAVLPARSMAFVDKFSATHATASCWLRGEIAGDNTEVKSAQHNQNLPTVSRASIAPSLPIWLLPRCRVASEGQLRSSQQLIDCPNSPSSE